MKKGQFDLTAPKKLQERAGLTSLPLPLYYQIADSIQERITAGEWPQGDKLPTEENLSKQYGVSRQTVRKAKDRLIRDGLINSVQGSGCFINPRQQWTTRPPAVENLREFFSIALRTSFKIQDYGMVANTPEIARHLHNEQDRFVFQIRGVRFLEGKPMSYVVYHLPNRFAVRIPLEELDENAFIPQFERLAGVQVSEGVQSISLGRVEAGEAEPLGLAPGEAVVQVETVYTDADGEPIEFVRSKYWQGLPYSITVRRE